MTAFGAEGVPGNPEAGTCSPICERREGRWGAVEEGHRDGCRPCVCLGRGWGQRGDSRNPAQPGSEMKTDTWGLAVLRTFNSGGTRGRKLGEKYSASRPSSRGCRGRVPPFLGAHTAVGGRERPLPGLGNQEGRPEREGASQGPLAVSQSVSLFTI